VLALEFQHGVESSLLVDRVFVDMVEDPREWAFRYSDGEDESPDQRARGGGGCQHSQNPTFLEISDCHAIDDRVGLGQIHCFSAEVGVPEVRASSAMTRASWAQGSATTMSS
jgi:hypothetical protein